MIVMGDAAMPRRWLPLLLCCTAALAVPLSAPEEKDSEESRRVLGSSVVTSVSVIMDLGNGTKKYFADAAGRPVPKPTAAAMVGSPAGLLNPDRYEFYTFDEAGDLVKRLMTLEEIQSIIANGETELGEAGLPNYYHQNLPPDSAELAPAASSTVTDKVVEEAEATDIGELSSVVPGVHDVVVSVQNVLKGELEASKNKIPSPKPVPLPPTPTTVASSDSSSSWGVILPGIMSNTVIVPNIASQSIYSTSSPILNTTQKLGNTSTGTPSHVTENVPLTTTQEYNNSSEASTNQKPLSPASSGIADVEQAASNSVNIHSKLPSLHSSPTSYVSSSLPPSSLSSSSSSSPMLSSLTQSPSTQLSSTSSSSHFVLYSSSPKPSFLLPLTVSHSSTKLSSTTLPSILTSLLVSSETPLSPQSLSLPASLPFKPSASPTVASTPSPRPQSSSLNNSYSSTAEIVSNHPLKDSSNVNENKPFNQYESYSNPTIGDNHITEAATQKPILVSHLPLFTSKIPSASSVVETESVDVSATSSVTQQSLSSSNEPSKIPVSNDKITLSQKVVGMSTIPSQTPSSHVERTTSPSVPTTSTASSISSNSIILDNENSELLEPAVVMVSSSESSNHDDISAAQEFFHLFTSVSNVSSTTYPLPTENIQPSKTTYRPSTATDLSRKPARPVQTTLTTVDITNVTTQPPPISSSSVQTSTANPLETKTSFTVINNKNEGSSTEEFLKTNAQNINSTTTELPLSSSTWKDNDESLLINEASGFVPVKIESPVGAVPSPSPANENLDMPPELAESVLGVLSQVADVEGAATTIDYGESGLYVFSSSATGTKHGVTEAISKTESSIYSSPNSTANYGSPQTSITSLHNGLTTESRNTAHSSPASEELSATTLHAEATQQNAVTKQSIRDTPTSQTLGSLNLKESTGDRTNVSLSMESASSVYEQDMTESSTIETEDEQKRNDPELKQDGTEDDKDVAGPNKEGEEVINLEDQSKVSKENIDSTSAELLSSANNNNEALKTSFEILKTEPNDEKTVTSVSEGTDSDFVSNTKIEAVDDITTVNDRTEQRETTVPSVTELTTEQPSPVTHRNNIKNEVNMESASILDIEETSMGTEAEELYNTATTMTPDTTSLREMIESSIQTTKENMETSTVTLTKYKKDDTEVAEGSMQDNLTLKPGDDSIPDKIGTDNKSSVQEHEAYDDKQNISTESEESTTQLENGTTEDAMQKEELNIPTYTTINTEFIQSTETRTDVNITDKNDESIHISEAKINTNLTENSQLTTELPTEGDSEDAAGHKTPSFETIHDMFAEEITTEVTSRYEAEVTTVDIKFSSDSEDNPSFRDEEPKGTTDASVTEDEGLEATTITSPETKIENDFTVTSLEKGSEVNMKDVHHWESNVTSSTHSLEKETEFEITKTTVDNTSWTKHSNASPSQANVDKIRDKTAFGNTHRPATVISIITTTTENATTPTGMLKFSGLNEEKVKDTKIKANPQEFQRPQTYTTVDLEPAPQENLGLEATSAGLEEDVRHFAELCNELAFRLWASVTTKGLTMSRSVVMSPFAVTSLLAMVFLGARGPTSGQMNDILRLDDMVTFNPHQVFRNITESVALSKTQGVATAVFIRQLYSDRTKGKLLDFYKERAQQFYDGHVEEVNFNAIGDLVRRRTNLLIKRQTHGRVPDYLRGSNILLRPPLAVFSANIFQTDCSQASAYGRDGEMYFTVMPAMRQRRLVPVPAVVWFSGFLAGYEPVLDATAASLGSDNSLVSLVMVLPGQQGQQAPGDGLQRLEQRLIESSYRRGAWSRLLRSLLPRPGLEIQIPRFSHRSLLNVTSPLQRMGLKDLFSAEHADLRGINGLANSLHLSDIIQVNTFSTCAEENVGSRHHVEVYPTSPQRSGREELDEDSKKGSVHFDDMDDLGLSSLPLALRPRQARLPDAPRLRFDRPFLYFVRHNPTGLILHMGRFNPRLLH